MNPVTLAVGAPINPPYTFPCSQQGLNRRPDCRLPGIHAEILGYILQLAHISYILEPLAQGTPWGERVAAGWGTVWSERTNRSWTGMLGLFENGSFDTLSKAYPDTYPNEMDFDFSYPVFRYKYVFVGRRSMIGSESAEQIVEKISNGSYRAAFSTQGGDNFVTLLSLKNSKLDSCKRIWYAINENEQHRAVYTDTQGELVDILSREDTVTIALEPDAWVLMHENCRLSYIDFPQFESSSEGFVFRKGDPRPAMLDSALKSSFFLLETVHEKYKRHLTGTCKL